MKYPRLMVYFPSGGFPSGKLSVVCVTWQMKIFHPSLPLLLINLPKILVVYKPLSVVHVELI